MGYEPKDWLVIVIVFFVLWWAMNWWLALALVVLVILLEYGFKYAEERVRARIVRRRERE